MALENSALVRMTTAAFEVGKNEIVRAESGDFSRVVEHLMLLAIGAGHLRDEKSDAVTGAAAAGGFRLGAKLRVRRGTQKRLMNHAHVPQREVACRHSQIRHAEKPICAGDRRRSRRAEREAVVSGGVVHRRIQSVLACGRRRRDFVRCVGESRVGDSHGTQNVFQQKLPVCLSGYLLNDARGDHVIRAGIFPFLTGRESERPLGPLLQNRVHGSRLLRTRGNVFLQKVVGVSGCVAEQLTDLDAVSVGEFGDELRDWVIEGEFAAIDENQDGSGRELFADRTYGEACRSMSGGGYGRGAMLPGVKVQVRTIRIAVRPEIGDFTVADNGQRDARDAVTDQNSRAAESTWAISDAVSWGPA